MATTCIFCDIVAKKSPAEIVHEDDVVVAFPDIHPSAPMHLLIIPKKHQATLETAKAETVVHMLEVAKRLGESHSNEYGYRLQLNSGKQAEVGHLHMHVLGGFSRQEPVQSQGGDSKE